MAESFDKSGFIDYLTRLPLRTRGLDTLSKNLRDIFNSQEDNDITFKVGNKEYTGHKIIIRVRSPVLYSQLEEHETSLNLDISDCDPDIFRDFLYYLYTGELCNVSKDNVFQLYNIADKYNAEEMKMECVYFMLNNLTIENICDVLSLGVTYNEGELMNSATFYFIENAKDILEKRSWKKFVKRNPDKANELFMKTFYGFKGEEKSLKQKLEFLKTNESRMDWSGELKARRLMALSGDLKELFLNEKDCDVILKVGGQTYSAHKVILKARSPVFLAMLNSDVTEKNEGVVDITDCDPYIFRDFLFYIYTGKLDYLSKGNMFELFVISDKYQVEEMKNGCSSFIVDNLTVDNVCDAISLGLKYKDNHLLTPTIDYFVDNSEFIFLTVHWKKLVKENPLAANAIFTVRYTEDDNEEEDIQLWDDGWRDDVK